MVVVVDADEVAELQVASSTGSLAGHTLHSTAIAEEDVCMVVEEVKARLVEQGARVSLCNGKSYSVREALTKRASGHLDTGRVVGFGVAGGDAVDLLQS